MKKVALILTFLTFVGFTLNARDVADDCHTKCAAKYPTSASLYLACMYGCL